MSTRTMTFVLAAALGGAVSTYAADTYEQLNDDVRFTLNLMRHGDRQVHDLQGAPPAFDQDWIRVHTRSLHSYEARVTGHFWDLGCVTAGCPRLARVDGAGTVLTPGTSTADDVPDAPVFFSLGQTVRWFADGVDTAEFLRVTGDQSAPLGTQPYTVVFRDTTLLVPRWNSSGTQTTVVVLQNPQPVPVTGYVDFYNGLGVLVQGISFTIAPNGVHVMSTAAFPALAGLSGSAKVSHDAGFGGITGKAVALEPATGFTFDTVIAPIPY